MNPRRELFCYYYVEGGNATKAAIRAGYSKRSAKQHAQVLLTKHDVIEKINDIQAQVVNRLKITIEDVLEGLARIAFADLNEVIKIKNDWELELIPGGNADYLAGLKYYKSKNRIVFSLKLEDRVKALCELARILGYHSVKSISSRPECTKLIAKSLMQKLSENLARRKNQ